MIRIEPQRTEVTVTPETMVVRVAAAGLPGAAGVGVPPGGGAGQVLVKVSEADHDTDWQTVPGGSTPARHVHSQSVPASTWTINHNLGAKPQIDVFTPGSVLVEAAIVHVSDNQAVVEFNAPMGGYAICQ